MKGTQVAWDEAYENRGMVYDGLGPHHFNQGDTVKRLRDNAVGYVISRKALTAFVLWQDGMYSNIEQLTEEVVVCRT